VGKSVFLSEFHRQSHAVNVPERGSKKVGKSGKK